MPFKRKIQKTAQNYYIFPKYANKKDIFSQNLSKMEEKSTPFPLSPFTFHLPPFTFHPSLFTSPEWFSLGSIEC